MERLRNSILWFILFLGTVFLLENITYGNQDLINIQPFVYILALFLAVFSIWVSQWFEIRVVIPLIFSLAVYLAFKLTIFQVPPLVGGEHTYLSLIEIVIFLGLIYLSYEVARNLRRVSMIMDDALLPKIKNRVHHMEQEEGLIENEFIRGRRYQFPITTIVIQPGGDVNNFPTEVELKQAINDISQNIKRKYLSTWLLKIISDLARSTDYVVTMNDSERLLIVAPGSSAENAQSLINRINKKITAEMGISPQIGLATFPEDGPTLEAVLNKAVGRMSGLIEETIKSEHIESLVNQER